ncbi:MAG: prolipoprotein diacylglyceryl transferase [Candidatus Margulisiibacteriota bacterium]|nr:prolipoprotein diacylglyceryl transferase [Candidatus Margulisiibacteriota bacterium]
MYPILFKIGPLSIHSYGVMVAIAFLVGIFVSIYYAKKAGIKEQVIPDLAIYVIIVAIAGARFFYVAGQWHQYKNNLIEIFMVQKGGLVFLGGFLLALITVVFYAKRKGIPLLKLFDILAPGAALGYAIGRIGCFLNGCCFGVPTDLPYGIKFPPGALAYSYFPDKYLHPTQLLSSGSMLLAFMILALLYAHKKFDGYIFFWGIIFYSVYRFLVEFLRYSPMHWLGLTPSQWIVLPLLIFGVFALAFNRIAKESS